MWEWIKWTAGNWTKHVVQIGNDLIPTVPPEVYDACLEISAYLQQHGWINDVFPVWALATAGGIVSAAIFAAIAIRVLRITVSVRSGGGGA